MRTDIPSDFSDAQTLDPDSCYRALTAKDARFDGVFFTGVKTTGIYCRPVCTVRTPRASSCTFFSSAAAAEAAGFRPCLRCRPELAPYALQQNLAHAVWQRIAAGALNDGDGERLAAEVGLSSRQLRRVLLQHFGVTPIELAQTQRLLFAKKLLQETRLAMVDVAYAAGFGSVRRFNALFAARYGMAPTDIRRAVLTADAAAHDGLTLRLAYRPPFGWRDIVRYLSSRAIPRVEVVALEGHGRYIPQADSDLLSAEADARSYIPRGDSDLLSAEADARSYMRSVRIADAVGWLRVSHLANKQQLELEVAPALAGVLMPLLARVRSQFDLDANPAVIEAHLRQDPLLARQLTAMPGLRVPGAFDAFELALRAVLGQQVSVAGATTLTGRLVARFGAPFATPFIGVTHHFPRADMLAAASVADIAQIGMPQARAETIRSLAQFAAEGGLNMTPGISLDDAVAQLKTVRGVGEWTAQYIALRALRFPDAFPAGDLGLQRAAGVGNPAPLRLSEKQLLARAAAWSPWRAYAALALWHSLNVAIAG